MRWEGESQFHHRMSEPLHPFQVSAEVFFPYTAPPSQLSRPPISSRRLLTGYGQERGSLGVEIVNNLDYAVEVIWIETWPWWIRGFVSSLEATGGEGELGPFKARSASFRSY